MRRFAMRTGRHTLACAGFARRARPVPRRMVHGIACAFLDAVLAAADVAVGKTDASWLTTTDA